MKVIHRLACGHFLTFKWQTFFVLSRFRWIRRGIQFTGGRYLPMVGVYVGRRMICARQPDVEFELHIQIF